MKIMLDKGVGIMPTRAHTWDAGLDLYAPKSYGVPATESVHSWGDVNIGAVTIDTGVHMEIPEGYVGLIKSRSSMNIMKGLICEGVIDAHYNGSIRVKIYNLTNEDYLIKAGDKIAQLVILPCLLPEVELVDSLEETDRGDDGFGSTGR